MIIYDYTVKGVNGEEISLSPYKGKVMLIVNTATKCGFTPQYEGLQRLYDTYKEQGLEILDFPCNQFFEQAPGTDEELAKFCQSNYHTSFETFAKIDVNGKEAAPLYTFLKKEAPQAKEDEASEKFYQMLAKNGFITSGDDIKWNFTKFLVDREGKVIARFAPTYAPEQLEEAIKEALNQ